MDGKENRGRDMKRRIRNNKGMTIIEVTLVLGLMSVVLISLFSVLHFNYSSYNTIQDAVDLQSDISQAFREMEDEILQSTTLYGHKADSRGRKIKVAFKRVSLEGHVDYYVVKLRKDGLFSGITTSSNPLNFKCNKKIATYISSIDFEYEREKNYVSIEMVASKGEEELTVLKGIGLRNGEGG